jgi:hypothetical protein
MLLGLSLRGLLMLLGLSLLRLPLMLRLPLLLLLVSVLVVPPVIVLIGQGLATFEPKQQDEAGQPTRNIPSGR